MKTRLYQNIPVEGFEDQDPASIYQDPIRKNSRFWNEGRWDNFIVPLLSKNVTDQVFVEMGCNAGLFLKLATDYGFRHVVGIEKNTTPVKYGLEYRDSIGYHYNLLKRSLGGRYGEEGSFDIDELPVADYTIMSTFHYYIGINSWIKYIDRLKSKTRYVLIVSRPSMRKENWRAHSSHERLKEYFSDWEEMGVVKDVSKEGDPASRDLFSILFKSPILERVALKDIDTKGIKAHPIYSAFKDLTEQVKDNDNLDLFTTDYYEKSLQSKVGKWTVKNTRRYALGKFNMLRDVKENGIKDAILLNQANEIIDGAHRLSILEGLDYESVIVRRA